MSRPSSPEARRLRFSSSFAMRCLRRFRDFDGVRAIDRYDAVIVSHDHVARLDALARAQITGTFTVPRLALIVPCAKIALAPHREVHLASASRRRARRRR